MSVGQQAQADRIRQMFDQVAARYDARNRLFSADRDQAWRRRAARRAALGPGQTALDLCTGTGKLAHELLHLGVEASRRGHRAADEERPCRAQDAPALRKDLSPAAQLAKNLNQHDGIEARISKRQKLTVRLHQAGRG